MAKCKSCGVEIIWVTIESSGKKMPVDAKPEKRVILLGRTSRNMTMENPAGLVDTHTSHFATCPNADEHRKAKAVKPC